MSNVVIIGATSGIGRVLAHELSRAGWSVGVTGRRTALLEEVVEELPGPAFSRPMDVTDTDAAVATYRDLVAEMGGIDLVVLNAAVGFLDDSLPWDLDRSVIDTNVRGFAALANAAYHDFAERGGGHLTGISSVAAVRGGGAPAYFASKAFVSSYLEGLRIVARKKGLPIHVTEVRPGFVDAPLALGEGQFWVVPVDEAARQIHQAIRRRRRRVYVSRRWGLVARVMQLAPDFLYERFV